MKCYTEISYVGVSTYPQLRFYQSKNVPSYVVKLAVLQPRPHSCLLSLGRRADKEGARNTQERGGYVVPNNGEHALGAEAADHGVGTEKERNFKRR